MKKQIYMLICVVSSLCQVEAHATKELSPGVLYPSTRSMAMGGTGISFYNGADSVFYNPASLRRKKGFKVAIINGYAEGSSDQVFANSGDNVGTRDLDERVLKLEQDKGGYFYDSAGGFPYIQHKNFLMGASYRDQASAYAPKDHGEKVTYSSRTDLNYLFAYATGFLNNSLQIGALGKVINRSEVALTTIEDTSTEDRSLLSYSNDLRTGRALNVDIGANLILPIAYLPTFSVVWRNIGQRKFKNKSVPFEKSTHSEPPVSLSRTMDAGFSLSPRFSRSFEMTMAVEYSDIYSNMAIGDRERIHAGIEFAFFRSFFLRGGFSHGEATYGLGMDLMGLTLDFSGYSIRRYDSQYSVEESERRWALHLGMRFF